MPTDGGTTIGAAARTPNAPRLLITIGAFTASTRPRARFFDRLIVALHEIRPVALVRIRHDGGRQPVVLERDRDAEIELIVLDDAIVLQNQAAKGRVFLHRPHDRPGNHDRRRGGILAVAFLRRFARLANRVPARVDLEIRRHDAAKPANDRGRERRFDARSLVLFVQELGQ